MVVYSSSATGFEAYYEKFGPDFSYPGVYTKNIGSGPGPATITLSEI
jgi:hypothetical protein